MSSSIWASNPRSPAQCRWSVGSGLGGSARREIEDTDESVTVLLYRSVAARTGIGGQRRGLRLSARTSNRMRYLRCAGPRLRWACGPHLGLLVADLPAQRDHRRLDQGRPEVGREAPP